MKLRHARALRQAAALGRRAEADEEIACLVASEPDNPRVLELKAEAARVPEAAPAEAAGAASDDAPEPQPPGRERRGVARPGARRHEARRLDTGEVLENQIPRRQRLDDNAPRLRVAHRVRQDDVGAPFQSLVDDRRERRRQGRVLDAIRS